MTGFMTSLYNIYHRYKEISEHPQACPQMRMAGGSSERVLRSEDEMMKFIPMDFPPELFLPKSERHSFYDDILPSEKVEVAGFFQPPMVWDPDSVKAPAQTQH